MTMIFARKYQLDEGRRSIQRVFDVMNAQLDQVGRLAEDVTRKTEQITAHLRQEKKSNGGPDDG